MNITLFTFGTRGDVQPYLALALGLQQAGHRVTLAAPIVYKEWIESYGVIHFPLRFDLNQLLMTKPQASGDKIRLRDHIRHFKKFMRAMSVGVRDTIEDCWKASQNADFVMQGGDGNGAVEFAEQLSIPMAFSSLYPFSPTREFVAFFWPFRRSLGRRYNLWTHHANLRFNWRTYGPPLNAFRARLGMPAWKSYLQMRSSRRHLGAPHIAAYSPALLPKPADWDETHEVIGYWFLDVLSDWHPPTEIENFLANGPAPFFFAFGSMAAIRDPAEKTRTILEALRRTGQRGVIYLGGGQAMARLPAPDTVIYVDSIPHSWLFPRVAAVIHHGGAGTTAAGFRAGVPQIVTPVAIDQIAWAEMVVQKKVGLSPCRFSGISADNMTQAIEGIVSDPGMTERAAVIAGKIAAEDGVGRAVEIIERHAAEFRARQTGRYPSQS